MFYKTRIMLGLGALSLAALWGKLYYDWIALDIVPSNNIIGFALLFTSMIFAYIAWVCLGFWWAYNKRE